MSPLRYKTLLTYLPGMASVVNTFESPQVQSAVYEVLMDALNTKLETEGLGLDVSGERPALTQARPLSNGELAQDLIEGDSIHAEQPRSMTKSATTVF